MRVRFPSPAPTPRVNQDKASDGRGDIRAEHAIPEGARPVAARVVARIATSRDAGGLPGLIDLPPRPGREAAVEAVAALCGIAADNFLATDRGGGPDAMVARCRFLRMREADHGLGFTEADAKAYGAGWRRSFEAICLDHLNGKPRLIHSPLHHVRARVVAEFMVHGHQVYVCLHEGRLFFAFQVGHFPVGLYYPAQDLFIIPDQHGYTPELALRSFLAILLANPERFAEYLARALEGRLRRAFVIGDMRPGHFIRESLGYIETREQELRAFLAKGALLVVIRDWCAMDPLVVFPFLREVDTLLVGRNSVNAAVLDLHLDAHRVLRLRTHRDSGWLQRRLLGEAAAVPAPCGSFRLMLSVDAEKARFLNQVEAFRFVLRRVGAACARLGLELELVWDGWTVANLPGEKDREVMAAIERVITAITEDLGVAIGRQERIFGLSAAAKVPALRDCDLAMVTQGTGAVIPNWLLQRTTITYHVARKVGTRSDLWEPCVVQVDQRAVIEPPAGPGADPGRFSIALWGLEDALLRAVGQRLGLTREMEGPDQTTMKAGTA
jgi:hypothetical protein